MVMGEGFSQVSNDDSGDDNGDNDGEDRKDENTSKKSCGMAFRPYLCGHCPQFPCAASLMASSSN